jgi:hypothetical protein
MLSQLIGFCQIGLIIISFAGPFVPFIRALPFYEAMQNNKMMFIFGAYFGLNIVQGIISSTGAF